MSEIPNDVPDSGGIDFGEANAVRRGELADFDTAVAEVAAEYSDAFDELAER